MDNNKKIVYLVLFDYSTDDCNGIDINLYDTYQKAVNRFKQIIEQEKNPNMSWVANAFDDEDKLINWYELDTNIEDLEDNQVHELWWNITDKFNYNYHSFIDLKIMKIE